MAAVMWSQDRLRRAALATLAECGFSGGALRIARRIIVIDGEQSVRETVIYDSDSDREARRKTRAVLRPAP